MTMTGTNLVQVVQIILILNKRFRSHKTYTNRDHYSGQQMTIILFILPFYQPHIKEQNSRNSLCYKTN